jgi:hypothetical protein
MIPSELEFTFLNDSTDPRGQSVSLTPDELAVLSEVHDVHIAAIKPGSIRGNHYHLFRHELITVVYDSNGRCALDRAIRSSQRSCTSGDLRAGSSSSDLRSPHTHKVAESTSRIPWDLLLQTLTGSGS